MKACVENNCKYSHQQEKKDGTVMHIMRTQDGNNPQIPQTRENLIEDQKLDADLTVVREQGKGERPQWQQITSFAPHLKGYCLQWEYLCIRDNLITGKSEYSTSKSMYTQETP